MHKKTVFIKQKKLAYVVFMWENPQCCNCLFIFMSLGSSCGSAVLHRAQRHSVWDCLLFQTRSHQGLCDSPL